MEEKNSSKLHKVNMVLYYAVLSILCAFAFYNFMRSGMEAYQTFMGRFFWQGIGCLSAAVFLTYGIRYKSIPVYLFTIAYYVVAGLLLHRTGYRANSPDLWAWYARVGIASGIVVPILVDAIIQKRIKRLSWDRLLLMGLFSTPILFSLIYHEAFETDAIVLLGMVWIVTLADIKREALDRLIVCICAGGAAGIMVVLIKCLIKAPYQGEYHYIGLYNDSPILAAFMGTGVVLCLVLYLILCEKYPKKKKEFLAGLIVFSAAYIFVAVIANGRNTFVALMCAFLLFFFLLSLKKGKKKIFLIAVGALVLVGIVGMVLVVLMTIALQYEEFAWIKDMPQLDQLQSLAERFANTKSHFGVFPEGSWWNRADYLVSWRLSVWTITIRQLKLFQGNSTAIVITEDLSWPTHNTYLGFLNKYGIVMGGTIVVGLIWAVVWTIKNTAKKLKDKELHYPVLLTAFWMLYFASIFMNESFYVVSYPMIVALFLLALLPKDVRMTKI